MLKILITIALILILTTSIYSQVDARFGGFRSGGFGGGGGFFGGGGGLSKLFSSHSAPLGAGQGKMFTSSPSGKISPQETTQSASKQTTPSSSSSSSNNNPQSNFQSQQSPFQSQPRSNFFGGGGGFGGFGSMIMTSIMGNFIGQALFGWMFPHPAYVVTPVPTHVVTPIPAQKVSNATIINNSTQKFDSQIKK